MLAIVIRAMFEAVSFVAFLVLLFSGTYVANEIYLAVKRAFKNKQTQREVNTEVNTMDMGGMLKQKIITKLIGIHDTKVLKTIYQFVLGLVD